MQVTRITSDSLIKRVTAWVSLRADVSALLLVGSHARGEARPDSDVDFVVLSTAPLVLASDHAWVSAFGIVRQVSVEDWGKLTAVGVWYEDGPEVEFGIAGLDWPTADGTAAVLAGGFRVLLGRDGLMRGLS
jgi:predicted nucleotidyltransferase